MSCGIEVPTLTGRGDATQEFTDIDSFDLLKPRACGFRNYSEKEFAVSPEEILLDKAQLLGLNPVELTLLVGGMRAMGVSISGKGVWLPPCGYVYGAPGFLGSRIDRKSVV